MKSRLLLCIAAVSAMALSSAVQADAGAKVQLVQQRDRAIELSVVQHKAEQAKACTAEAANPTAQARAYVPASEQIKIAADKLSAGDPIGALLALLFGAGGVAMAMTTLAANSPRVFEIGTRNEFPVIAADIIYEGGAAGMVSATGHVQPLTSSDRFVGFAEMKADNSAGAAAAINCRVIESGKIKLSVSGAVITDVGQPVYATDDDTFVFNPVGAVFIGFVHRFESSGVVVVEFDAPNYTDPYGDTARKTKSVNYTVDATDNGTTIFVDTDAVVITLPAVGGISGVKVVNIAAFGAAKVSVSPNAADMVEGPGITAADDKDIINTKATARRGDYVLINDGDANGWSVVQMRGTWAREA